MLDMIALVTGVPALLFVMLIAMGRFEATVAPDLDQGSRSRVEWLEQRAPAQPGSKRVAVAGSDAEHRRAA